MSILASRLDQKKPEFKDLAEQLYSKITEDLNTKAGNFYKLNLSNIARVMDKPDPFDFKFKQSDLKESYLSKILKKMGNNVTHNQGRTVVDSYMPDTN